MRKSYIVYAKLNSEGYITQVNSSAFLDDTTGWIEIGRGHTGKCCHAQGNYFEKPIITEDGAYRYKLEAGKVMECTAEEINAQGMKNLSSSDILTLENRIKTLELDSSNIKEMLERILKREACIEAS